MGKSHHVSIMQEVGNVGEIVEVDAKGRIVIPIELREKFGIEKGS